MDSIVTAVPIQYEQTIVSISTPTSVVFYTSTYTLECVLCCRAFKVCKESSKLSLHLIQQLIFLCEVYQLCTEAVAMLQLTVQ